MARKSILDMISSAAAQERVDLRSRFIAPVYGGCAVRTKIGGMLKTFSIRPNDFEGWGIFQCSGGKKRVARLVEDAMDCEIEEYVSRLPKARVRLCLAPADDSNWIAYPCNENEMLRRFGISEPIVVRLVDGVGKFESINVRFDGVTWWFESRDSNDDMSIVDEMLTMASRKTRAESLRIKGLTPEMRKAYDIYMNPIPVTGAPDLPMTDEDKLAEALERGGGRLVSHVDRGDRWSIEWETSTGERHSSAISKEDMTVISAGVCLAGEDARFDLHTIVGVVERRHSSSDYEGW